MVDSLKTKVRQLNTENGEKNKIGKKQKGQTNSHTSIVTTTFGKKVVFYCVIDNCHDRK